MRMGFRGLGATQCRGTALLHTRTGLLEAWGAGFEQTESIDSKLRKHHGHASNLIPERQRHQPTGLEIKALHNHQNLQIKHLAARVPAPDRKRCIQVA